MPIPTCYCSTLLLRGADFNVEDDEGAQPDELARQCHCNSCHDAIVRTRHQHMAQLSTLIKQVLLLRHRLLLPFINMYEYVLFVGLTQAAWQLNEKKLISITYRTSILW